MNGVNYYTHDAIDILVTGRYWDLMERLWKISNDCQNYEKRVVASYQAALN